MRMLLAVSEAVIQSLTKRRAGFYQFWYRYPIGSRNSTLASQA